MGLKRYFGIGAATLALSFGSISRGTDTGVGIGLFNERQVNFYRSDLDGLSEATRDAPNFMSELIVRNPGADFCVDVYDIRKEIRDWDFEDKLTKEQELLSSTNEGTIYVIHFNGDEIGRLIRVDTKSILFYDGRFPGHADMRIRKQNETSKYRMSEDHVILVSGYLGREGTANIPFDDYKSRESFMLKKSDGIGFDTTTEDFLPLIFQNEIP